MRTRSLPRYGALMVALLVALAGTVSATPALTMTSPVSGATVSRAENPTIILAGGVAFDAPEPTTRSLYLRRSTCDLDLGFLSDAAGLNGGNACEGLPDYALTAAGLADYSHEFRGTTGQVKLPITVDASRNLTGQINFRANTNTPAWQHFEVDIRLGSTVLARQSVEDTLPQLSSFRTLDLDVPIPSTLDKVDITDVSVTVYYRRSTLSWVELNNPAAYIALPSYTASFNRRVETRIGTSGNFTAATHDDDFTQWSRAVTTPAVGSHFVQARAVQGSSISPVVQHVLHVTE